MISATDSNFDRSYQSHIQHLKLKGLRPKTIEAYGRGVRRAGEYFDHAIDDLSEAQFADYFSDLLASHSWSAVMHDWHGLRHYNANVLHKPRPALSPNPAKYAQKLTCAPNPRHPAVGGRPPSPNPRLTEPEHG